MPKSNDIFDHQKVCRVTTKEILHIWNLETRIKILLDLRSGVIPSDVKNLYLQIWLE